MVFPEVILEIGKETWPLILFATSIILFGMIMDWVYYGNANLNLKSKLGLISGLFLNLIALFVYSWISPEFAVGLSWDNLKVYTDIKLWVILVILTSLGAFSTWEVKNKGKKWIKDTILDNLVYMMGLISATVAFLGVSGLFSNTVSFLAKPMGFSIFIEYLLKIISGLLIIGLFGYAAYFLMNSSNRGRRYTKTK